MGNKGELSSKKRKMDKQTNRRTNGAKINNPFFKFKIKVCFIIFLKFNSTKINDRMRNIRCTLLYNANWLDKQEVLKKYIFFHKTQICYTLFLHNLKVQTFDILNSIDRT